MRVIGFLAVAVVVLFIVNSCAGHGPYRIADKNCAPISLGGDNNESIYADQDSLLCSIQTHAMASAFPVPAESKGIPADPDRFQLAFVELGNGVPEDIRQRQLDALLGSLRRGQQDYVIAFIHGWRHNAEIGDGDVRKLRALLAYARSFLNTRCVDHGRYCDARLTGVYVGWRGASFIEPAGSGMVGTIGAAPTFWSRKNESERLKGEIQLALRSISGSLDLAPGNFDADKMLVVGHSFGGNMLATAFRDELAENIANHPIGGYFSAPVGDLIVLVNPASEALNWTKLQEALASRGERSITVDGDPDSDRFEQVFARDQRPNYLSITSVCDWAEAEVKGMGKELRPVGCDVPTSRLFPIGQAMALKWDSERMRTIGHLDPVYERSAKDGRVRLRDGSRRVGTSHEFITNFGGNVSSDFRNAANPDLSRCDVADGWLKKATGRMGGAGRGWDTAYDAAGKRNNILWVDRRRGIFAQFRHRLSLSGYGAGELASVAPATSPFWNVRAFDTAIEDHGGYVGYSFWCSVNQLILDDVSAPNGPS